MAYKVIDIYKDLPQTNCNDCNKGNCFAFATAVYLENHPLSECPHLEPEKLADMEHKLGETMEKGGGKKPELSKQALEFLIKQLEGADLAELAEKCAGEYVSAPEEGVKLNFLNSAHLVTATDAFALEGEAPSVWIKIFLMIYVTRANGNPPVGEWAAFRELPNTVSKSKSFEDCAEKIAEAFSGDLEGLDRAATGLGGEPSGFGSADRTYLFHALPRVDLLLLFWDGEEEFPARASLLVDRGVLDYLDQEALVFCAEALAQKLKGQSLGELIT